MPDGDRGLDDVEVDVEQVGDGPIADRVDDHVQARAVGAGNPGAHVVERIDQEA